MDPKKYVKILGKVKGAMKRGSKKGGESIEEFIIGLYDKYIIPDEVEIDFEQICADAERYEADPEKEQLRQKQQEFRRLEKKAMELTNTDSSIEGWSADSSGRRGSNVNILNAIESIRDRYESQRKLEG